MLSVVRIVVIEWKILIKNRRVIEMIERKKEYDELMKDISDSIDYATYTKVFCENDLRYCKRRLTYLLESNREKEVEFEKLLDRYIYAENFLKEIVEYIEILEDRKKMYEGFAFLTR